MNAQDPLSRRRFLYGTALAAGAVTVSACSGGTKKSPSSSASGGGSTKKGSATTAPKIPAHFQESPALKEKGLPDVAKRLPQVPYVVPHLWVEPGKYGGTMNMAVFSTTGMGEDSTCYEFFYGPAPLRWLNDGLAVGPGLLDKWSSNADATEWTVHYRSGLKWSDGQPVTVDDTIFWWEDLVLPGHNALTPPLGMLSAAGKPCHMTKVDDETLKLTYDSPQPGLPLYLATGVNGHMTTMPKHYLKQFHPKYNSSVPKDWDSVGGLWEQKSKWMRNPACPTLAGYRCQSFDINKGVVLERNPYYYVVNTNGDQLPYIDKIVINCVQNSQVIKLQVQQGKIDYCHGPFNQIDLSDVSTLNRFKDSGDYRILLWDSGSGTGDMFFLNYDYIANDQKYGKLFRDKRFRQAISHAYDRTTARKTLYFGTGEITTGSLGPKAPEFNTKPSGPSLYAQWRDSYSKHDPAKAKALLADLGLKDSNGDGYVEFPDGSKLTVSVPYSADQSATGNAHDDQLVADAKKVGIHLLRTPIPPTSFNDMWAAGKFMSRTNWEVSNGSLLVAAYWLLPLENARWAPLEGMMYAVTGTANEKKELNVAPAKRHPPRMAPEKGGPVEKMWNLYNAAKREPDALKRTQHFWDIIKVHIEEGPFFMGVVTNYLQPIIAKNDLRNVPTRDNLAQHGLVNDWELPCPAVYEPETYYWSNPSSHTT
ncbi:MAG TPA: ABC transporter substrate-binding protein [Mycobacteriales bacterium]|nr:ABC transporter substrate-binding protein [Mycobacteriales bacterium]